jgi:hypothetical protein
MRPTIPPTDVNIETSLPESTAVVESSIIRIENKLDELEAVVKEIHSYLAQTRNLIADCLGPEVKR